MTRDYAVTTDYRYGKREYSSLLHDLPGGVNKRDACYDPQNSPIVFGRVRYIMYCTRNLGGTWGHVYISDGLCGHCRNRDLSCLDDGDATWHDHVRHLAPRPLRTLSAPSPHPLRTLSAPSPHPLRTPSAPSPLSAPSSPLCRRLRSRWTAS